MKIEFKVGENKYKIEIISNQYKYLVTRYTPNNGRAHSRAFKTIEDAANYNAYKSWPSDLISRKFNELLTLSKTS